MNAKIIDKEVPIEFLTIGYYFQPPSDHSSNYLIRIRNIDKGNHCLVEIYTTGIPQADGHEIKCTNGDYIAIHEADMYFSIDIWSKYYFPKFEENHNYQWYHEDAKYPSNTMKGFYEVMQFAYDLGIKMAEIKPL